ncbi:DNA excision repair protein ERCC-5 [Anopheles ziemanni]|uniref:DNA excision repair protein ERCC-5 n=1 Tax=Anopheles coustani TaxID=139045 RepID=UPI00265AEBA4|nr:DNA excision repair protein ERCC-5 [Anopheles coustani]XP_058168427.1 DNA excision repair protein ERCC-5 [Anopheles ziemanni]
MGVLGLWKLIEQAGKPVPLDTLENKVLAVDISIWLHQVIKGFQDSKGSALPNAHVLGLFHRLCKLMYYRIKPIFVFDGGVPVLKKQTIAKRHQSKNNYQNEADRIQQLLLETLAKEKVVQQALGSATNILISPSKKAITSGGAGSSKQPGQEEEPDAMFKLPPLKAPEEPIDLDRSDSSMDEKASRNYYHLNLNAIDVTSVYFKNLPADVRHEILNDIKETRKQSSWGRLHELPVESNSFSSFQMNRLLKRRQVQVELEEAEKEMGGKCLSLVELESLLNEEGVETSSSRAAQQIASDENTRFLLVRDVQKAIEKAKAREEEQKLAPKPPKLAKLAREDGAGTSRAEALDDDDKEMDEELQLAIKMSLMQDENPHALIELDDDDIRMSRTQKQVLGNAAQSLARGFMLEYGGLTSEEFNELLHQTQDVDGGDINDSMSQMFVHNGASIVEGPAMSSCEKPTTSKQIEGDDKSLGKESVEEDTESDSDFIDVPEDDLNDSLPGISLPLNSTNHFKPHFNPIVDFTIDDLKKLSDVSTTQKKKKAVEVFIKEEDMGVCDKDDIFADIFVKKENNMDVEKEGQEKSTSEQLPMTIIPITDGKGSLSNVTVAENEPNDTPKDLLTTKPPSFGIKIKNVDDINAQLKEELENLKKGAPVIDLDIVSNKPCIVVEEREKASADLKRLSETLKQQLEELKASANAVNLDDIKLDTIPIDKEKLTTADNDYDSDGTIIYDSETVEGQKTPCKEISPKKKAGIEKNSLPLSKNADEGSASAPVPVIEILDSPVKKGTLEHLVIARTPGKDTKADQPDEVVPHVTKPFFVNKTPPSSGKKNVSAKDGAVVNESVPVEKSGSGVAKELFPSIDSEPVPSTSKQSAPAEPKPVNAEHLITEMADTLKESRTPLELKQMALDLAQTERELEREKNKQNRLGVSITEQMRNDCMELLSLFGVPYIVAPMEAEAQCAFLNQIEMTDGTITDDSDIWLFGGQKVYKNFFNQQKLVQEFTIEAIEQMFHMDRNKLIQLALLVGSDYTTGIHGIGAVTALEILASFPPTPEQAGETSEMMSLLSGLRRFRDWWQHGRNGATVGARMALKSKLKNIDIHEGFPSTGVVEAYLRPTVDCSEEQFTWGYPDADRLRDYARQKFGWTQSKTNDILLPVLKRLDERKSQASIKDFFKVQSAVAQSRLKVSKRVQYAVDTMAGKVDPAEDKPKQKKGASPRKAKQAAGPATRRKQKASSSAAESVESIDLDTIDEGDEDAGEEKKSTKKNDDDDFVVPKATGRRKGATGNTNAATANGKPKRGGKKSDPKSTDANDIEGPSATPGHSLANIGGIIANINQQSADSLLEEPATRGRKKRLENKIPDFNPPIPQRVKDEQEMAERKQRAAALFKKVNARKSS